MQLKNKRNILLTIVLSFILATMIYAPLLYHFASAALMNGYTPTFEHPATEASCIIWKEGSTYYSKNGTSGIVTSSTNASYLLQTGLDGLTAGRNSKETVFWKGTLTITHTITFSSHTKIVLDGVLIADSNLENSSVLKGQGSAYGENNATYNVLIQGGRIDGNSVTGVIGILLNWTWRTTIRDVDIRNCKDGIYVYQSEQERIENCKVGGNSRYGICFDGSGGASEIEGCEIHASGTEGIYLVSDVGDVKITECDFYGNDRHIHLYGSRTIQIETNAFTTGTVNHLTLFNTNHSIIKSNTFKNVASGYYTVRIDNSFNTSVTANMIFDTRTPKLQKGILEENNSDYNQFKNNIIETLSPTINATGTHTIVKGNIGFVTEASGTASGVSPIVVAHGLAGEPTSCELTAYASQMYGATWTANITHLTIYHTASGSLDVGWTATYDPSGSTGSYTPMLESYSEASLVVFKVNSTHYAYRNMSTLLVDAVSTNASQIILSTLGSNRHIYVTSGTYDLDTQIMFREMENLTFRCEKGAAFTTTLTSGILFRFMGYNDNIEWIGGTIQGSSDQYDNDVYAIGLSGYGTGNNDITLDGVTIRNFSRGIRAEEGEMLTQDGFTVKNCRLENIKYETLVIKGWATNVVITNNFIKNTEGNGIYVIGANVVISGNVIEDSPMVSDYHAAITAYNPHSLYFENITRSIAISDNTIRWVNAPTSTNWVIGILVSGENQLTPQTHTHGVTVTGNTITGLVPSSNKTKVGIYLHTDQQAGGHDNIKDVVVSGNTMVNMLNGIVLMGQYISCTGNIAENCTSGIILGGASAQDYPDCATHSIISDNILKGFNKTAVANLENYGIYLSYHAFDNKISDNYIEDFYYGIRDYGTVYCGNNTIRHNDIYNCTAPINVTGTNTLIHGNVGFVTENSGTATNTTATTFVFNHGLAGNPQTNGGVWASFNTTAISGWSWTATSTQITITVSGSSLPEIMAVYFNAVYKP